MENPCEVCGVVGQLSTYTSWNEVEYRSVASIILSKSTYCYFCGSDYTTAEQGNWNANQMKKFKYEVDNG